MLEIVDSFLENYPDSALSVLSEIDEEALKGEEARARYNLLSALAKLKSGIYEEQDSLVEKAYDFYSKQEKASRETMLSHFAMGGISNSAVSAIMEFDKTIELATEIGDKKYKALSYFNKSVWYGKEYNVLNERECIDKGLECLVKSKDTEIIMHGHLLSGLSYIGSEQPDSAYLELSIVRQMAQIYGDSVFETGARLGIAHNYCMSCRPEMAVPIFDSIYHESGEDIGVTYILSYARALTDINELERASRLLDDIGDDVDLNDRYNRLDIKSKIAYRKGDFREAYLLADSVMNLENEDIRKKLDYDLSRKLLDMEKKNAQAQLELAQSREMVINWQVVAFVFLAIAIGMATYIMMRWHKSKVSYQERRYTRLKERTKKKWQRWTTRMKQLQQSLSETRKMMRILEESNHEYEGNIRMLNNQVSALEKIIGVEKSDIPSLTKRYGNALKERARFEDMISKETNHIGEIRTKNWEILYDFLITTSSFCNNTPASADINQIKIYEQQRNQRLELFRKADFIVILSTHINELMEGILGELQEKLKLRNQDITMLIYEICGFNYTCMGLLFGIDPSTASVRRTRLKNKLKSVPERYIPYLSKYTRFKLNS